MTQKAAAAATYTITNHKDKVQRLRDKLVSHLNQRVLAYDPYWHFNTGFPYSSQALLNT